MLNMYSISKQHRPQSFAQGFGTCFDTEVIKTFVEWANVRDGMFYP
jgi:hypothetical protein